MVVGEEKWAREGVKGTGGSDTGFWLKLQFRNFEVDSGTDFQGDRERILHNTSKLLSLFSSETNGRL